MLWVEQLMHAKPDIKAGDQLDILTTLVKAYEARHHAVSPPDPGEAIRFRMDRHGMTRKDLDALLGERGGIPKSGTGSAGYPSK